MKPEIVKTERTDKDVDNSVYEIPIEHTDDYGNLYYTKEIRPCVEYGKEIQAKNNAIQKEINDLKDNNKIAKKIAEKEAELLRLDKIKIITKTEKEIEDIKVQEVQ
jgi:transcriptional antiterminator Rof (Rho-off)